jgi:transcriptional regulator with XRE-family HTH domain
MQHIYRNIAWKIINLRQAQELSQEGLGKKLGLSRYQVSRMEKGFGDTTLANLNLVCQYFKIPLESLFRFEEKRPLRLELRPLIKEKNNRLGDSVDTQRFQKVSAK